MATRSEFSKQLDEVETLVARLGEKSAADVRAAGLATQGDTGAAEGVLQGRKAADRLRNEIETLCLDIMLLQQPLIGEDLRLVSGSFRLVSDLHQIDNMCRDIAFIISELPADAVGKMGPKFREMSDHVAGMVTEALEAFEEADPERACKVIDSDNVVDELYGAAEDDVIDLICAAGKSSAKSLPELLMVAKYFERIGDQAQRIAAWAVFRATGERILTNGGQVIELRQEAGE